MLRVFYWSFHTKKNLIISEKEWLETHKRVCYLQVPISKHLKKTEKSPSRRISTSN